MGQIFFVLVKNSTKSEGWVLALKITINVTLGHNNIQCLSQIIFAKGLLKDLLRSALIALEACLKVLEAQPEPEVAFLLI